MGEAKNSPDVETSPKTELKVMREHAPVTRPVSGSRTVTQLTAVVREVECPPTQAAAYRHARVIFWRMAVAWHEKFHGTSVAQG